METIPTASTKKMRVRSKSTSDVGDSQKYEFVPPSTAVKGKVGLNGRAASQNGVVPRKDAKHHDRKSRSGLRGLPKKGGAGGKGTWGAIGEVLSEEDLKIKDHHDPNYESEEDEDDFQIQEVKPQLTSEEFDLHVDPIVLEYFEHGDTQDVIYSLNELNISSQKHKVVVLVVTHAFDKKASHRELASVLISDLYGKVLKSSDISKGFQSLLEDLDDLCLDVPQATDHLAKFIARAVADDALAPAYVSNHHEGTTPDSLQRKCLEEARVLLKMKHGMCRLDRVWGVGGGRLPVKCLVKRMIMLLKEYLESEDVEEACRCVVELEVPHFHHELIYEAIYLVMDQESMRTLDLMRSLLKTFSTVNVVTPEQMRNGFQRVFDSMDDITLDIPHARTTLEKFVTECAKEGIIPRALVLKIPTRGRKRFVSEGDGGLFKHT